MEMKENCNILIVEDEMLIAFNLKLFLENNRCRVIGLAGSEKEAIRAVEQHRPEVIIMDIKLKGNTSGINLSNRIRADYNPFIIFTTGNYEKETINRLKEFKNSMYLIKPVNEFKVLEVIHNHTALPPAEDQQGAKVIS